MTSVSTPNDIYGDNEKHRFDNVNSPSPTLIERNDKNVTVAETEISKKSGGNIHQFEFNDNNNNNNYSHNNSHHDSSSHNNSILNDLTLSSSSKNNSDSVTGCTFATDDDCTRDVDKKHDINKYNIYKHHNSFSNHSEERFHSCLTTPETTNGSLRSLDMKYSRSDVSSHSPRRLLETPDRSSVSPGEGSLNSPSPSREGKNTSNDNDEIRNENDDVEGENNKNVHLTTEEEADVNTDTMEEPRSSPPASLRARLDSEEQYRALAASHAASNPHMAFFSVDQNKLNRGHHESPNNSGSVLYIAEDDSVIHDQTYQGNSGRMNMNAQNSSNKFFPGNRDRMSSVDSNGSLILTKNNQYNNSYKQLPPSDRIGSNRPPVAMTSSNRYVDSQPELPTQTKVLPYHKRKLLAERQKQASNKEIWMNANKINQSKFNNKINNNTGNNNTAKTKKQNNATIQTGYKTKRPNELTTISSTPHFPPNNHGNRSSKLQQKQPNTHQRFMSAESSGSNFYTNSDNASTESSSPEKDPNAENSKPFHKAGLPLHPSSRHNGKDHHHSSHVYNEQPFSSSPNQNQQNQSLTVGYHVRAESGGSISSLGSNTGGAGSFAPHTGRSLTDRLGKEISSFLRDSSSMNNDGAGHIQRQKQHKNNGSLSSFISGIMDDNFSPKSATSIEDTKADFHEKNQAFLQKAEQERFKRNIVLSERSNTSNSRRVLRSRSPRPPNVQGAHRPGLSSIDNDNWEEDAKDKNGEGTVPHSHRGRTQKVKPRYNDKAREGEHTQHVGTTVDYEKYHDRQHGSRSQDYSNSQRESSNLGKGYNINYTRNEYTENTMEDKYMSRNYGSTSLNRDPRKRTDDHLRKTVKKNNRSIPRARDIGDEMNHPPFQNVSSGDFESSLSESSESDDQSSIDRNFEDTNEQTRLLPPPGISTYERREYSRHQNYRSNHHDQKHRDGSKRENKKSRKKERYEREKEEFRRWEEYQKKKRRRKKRDKRSRSRQRENINYSNSHDYSTDDESFSDDEKEYRNWLKRKTQKLMDKERKKYMEYWKAEAKAQLEAQRKEAERNRCCNRCGQYVSGKCSEWTNSIKKFLSTAETFISNLPLVIGAVALAIVTLGVVWFKFAEENLDTCKPVHFHSSQCSFPEFPGCFFCDTSATMYKVAVYFHYTCSTIAGLLSMLFFAKVILARKIVMDEMSSPTTSSPAGLICMTMVCVFAGRGWIGQLLVTLAACMHLCLAGWFVYLALAYNIMPEPSWYPNTVGIGLSAVKTWLYYPMPGHFLMAISLSLNIFFFPLSLVRVSLNQKISAPVCWIQMSAPAVALYALTIMAQPSFEEENPDMTQFQRIHRSVYMPIMHFLFINSVIGVVSSIHSLKTRWKSFSKKEFSPAHAAFCFPTLAHANAVQAYRGAINSFSNIPPHSAVKIAIYIYWVIFLVGGTIATIIITTKFFRRLPSWTIFDIAGEIEPPAPNQTVMSEVILVGEHVKQNYVSPAVLQANETGQLIRHRDADGRSRYVRTRQITALGFEPIMNQIELQEERDALLEWVARNPPRTRKRTLSVPGIDFSSRVGADFGTGNSGVWYDIESRGFRERAHTIDNNNRNNRRNRRGSTMHN